MIQFQSQVNECYYAYTLYKIFTLFHIQCLYSIDTLMLEVLMMPFETRLDIVEKTQREILDALLIIQKNQKPGKPVPEDTGSSTP